MNSPLETQLGDELRRLTSDQPFEPNLETIGAHARKRYRRGRTVRGVSAAALGVAVVAGGLFAVGHGTAGAPTATAAGAPTATSISASAAPRVETVAYVTKQVKAALGNVDNYIQYSSGVFPWYYPVSSQNWVDPRTGNSYETFGSGKALMLEWGSNYLVNKVLTSKATAANYSTHTWYTDVESGPNVPLAPTTTPQQVKAMLDSGKFTLIGKQEINGQQAIGLYSSSFNGSAVSYDLWVNAQNFLPLRVVSFPGTGMQEEGNISWLPRTASLVSKVNTVHIPVGFKEVKPPAGQ